MRGVGVTEKISRKAATEGNDKGANENLTICQNGGPGFQPMVGSTLGRKEGLLCSLVLAV